MDTTGGVHKHLCSNFNIVIVALIVLLNTFSSGQLVPSSNGSSEQTSPSNTSSDALKEYVIYSIVEGSSPDSDNEKVRLHLGMILAPAYVQEYGGEYTGVEFWRVIMSDTQRVAFMSANPKAQVQENTQFLFYEDLGLSQNHDQKASGPELSLSEDLNGTNAVSGPFSGVVYQHNAPSDLRVVSWAPRVPFGSVKSYAYDAESIEQSIIYLIENGIDERSREFMWPPQDWIYAPSVTRTETDDDPLSHGSCVASKAIGIKNGVAKTAKLVVVKSSLNLVDITWAFQQIVNTVAKQKNKRVVVLLPATTKIAWRSELFQDARFSRLYLRMKNLINLGAVVVVPAGDYGQRKFFADTVPAVFTSTSKILGQRPLPLLVAGAVDNRGVEAPFSQTTLTGMVWAPGVKVACTKKGFNIRPTGTGTSFSAGMVAGLAAYFLGMKFPPFATGGPDTAENMIDYLQNSASWARIPGKRKVVWNRLDGSLDEDDDGAQSDGSRRLSLTNVSAAVGALAQEKA